MIHLDTIAAHAPVIGAVVGAVPIVASLRRRRPPTMREQVAADNAARLRAAGLLYRVPTYDGHSEKARAR